MAEEEQKYHAVEWCIENFDCWNRKLHDLTIASKSHTNPELTIELFPRGTSGYDDHLAVRISYSYARRLGGYFGDLSYIGADGTLICTQQVDSRGEQGDVLELPPGPKFEEVVAKGERLTVRFRTRNSFHHLEYRRTTIDVFDAALKISMSDVSDESTDARISWLCYPLDREGIGQMIFLVSKDGVDPTKILLSLQPVSFKKIISVRTRLSMLNKEEDVVWRDENEHLFRDETTWRFPTSLTSEEMAKGGSSLVLRLKIVPSNKFKQLCGLFHYHPDRISTVQMKNSIDATRVSEEPFNLNDRSVGVLTKELMCLYQDHDFSDFQLKCDNVTFPVHKNILSARSPVFKTMLSTDMRESVSGCMDVEDLDPSTLGLFLTYLYTGAVKELQGESALKLYYAADKYQVPSLKRECVDFLSVNVSISNVCDILPFATGFQDDQLIAVAHDFVLKNYNEVLSSEEWKSFMRNEPLLAVETLTLISLKRSAMLEEQWLRKT